MGKVLRGGKGSLTGSVSWPGSPLSPDTAKMSGQIKVAIDAGQVLNASPGAARLLGVFSMQSLQRRLLLDFRDLFEEGFVFDNVTGDLKLGAGVATTNNLRMRGPAAVVLMEGEADIERETQNLRVVRRAGDQRRHRVARLCLHQSGDRPRHLPGPVLPEQADRRGQHPRVPRHRPVGRSEGRAGRAQPCSARKPAGEAPDAAAAADPPKTTTTR